MILQSEVPCLNLGEVFVRPVVRLPYSRILSLCQERLSSASQETFVDPRHFRGTVYRAANQLYVGDTKGFRRAGKAGWSLSDGATV